MIESKNKAVYSKNEKILRIICFVGIIISEIIGILLLCIGKIGGGITVLIACLFASFLVSSFMIGRIKYLFKDHPKKRVIYACFYAFIIVLAMLTAFIVGLNSSYPVSDLANTSIEFAEERVSKLGDSVTINGTEILDYFSHGDSYYFELETEYITESMSIKTTRTELTYVKINKETARYEQISSYNFVVAKSYSK